MRMSKEIKLGIKKRSRGEKKKNQPYGRKEMLLRTRLCCPPPLADHPPKRSWRRLSPRVASNRRLPGDRTPWGSSSASRAFPFLPSPPLPGPARGAPSSLCSVSVLTLLTPSGAADGQPKSTPILSGVSSLPPPRLRGFWGWGHILWHTPGSPVVFTWLCLLTPR